MPSATIAAAKPCPGAAVKTPEFQNAPFFQMVKNKTPFERYRLNDPFEVRAKYPLFETLGGIGITDYIALFASYGRKSPMTWADLPAGVEGAIASHFPPNEPAGFLQTK